MAFYGMMSTVIRSCYSKPLLCLLGTFAALQSTGYAAGRCEEAPSKATQSIRIKTSTGSALISTRVQGSAFIVEGDIVIAAVEQVWAAAKAGRALDPLGIGVHPEERLWPGRVIPYEVTAELLNDNRLRSAIQDWNSSTSVQFKDYTDEQEKPKDRVLFVRMPECSASQVGKQGGVQPIWISDLCTTGNILHELGHAAGLWHEQSRKDREDFVRIEWNNIAPVDRTNFTQRIHDGRDILSYDYGSLMHYPSNAFAINSSLPTIVVTRIPPEPIGQRHHLSDLDKRSVEDLYRSISTVQSRGGSQRSPGISIQPRQPK